MICTTLNDLYNIEWFVLHWIIWTMLNGLYSIELFVERWIICTALDDLYYLEWFVQHWMIFTTLKNLYDVKWFVQHRMIGVRWMICTMLNHLDYDELLSIGFLMSARCTYSRQYCKIFFTNLWVGFFLIWKYQEEVYPDLPQKMVIKRCFWWL